jgi:hypothetical protein
MIYRDDPLRGSEIATGIFIRPRAQKTVKNSSSQRRISLSRSLAAATSTLSFRNIRNNPGSESVGTIAYPRRIA